MQVFVGRVRSSSEISVWHSTRQLTFISSARRIMSGWLPHSTMLSREWNSRFSRLWGRAMVTSPEMVSVFSPASLRILPSRTEMALNSGTSSSTPELVRDML